MRRQIEQLQKELQSTVTERLTIWPEAQPPPTTAPAAPLCLAAGRCAPPPAAAPHRRWTWCDRASPTPCTSSAARVSSCSTSGPHRRLRRQLHAARTIRKLMAAPSPARRTASSRREVESRSFGQIDPYASRAWFASRRAKKRPRPRPRVSPRRGQRHVADPAATAPRRSSGRCAIATATRTRFTSTTCRGSIGPNVYCATSSAPEGLVKRAADGRSSRTCPSTSRRSPASSTATTRPRSAAARSESALHAAGSRTFLRARRTPTPRSSASSVASWDSARTSSDHDPRLGGVQVPADGWLHPLLTVTGEGALLDAHGIRRVDDD